MKKLKNIAWLAASLSSLMPVASLAQRSADSFPSKPMTVVSPYEPGGPIDTEARLYTKKMADFMPQPFIIEYKSGAATRIGLSYVAKAAPDGYTMLFTTGSFTILPALYKNLPFDSIKDFAPVSQMSLQSGVFLVRPSFPANNFAEYLAYARTNPGKVNFGMLGSGSTPHLVGAWLETLSNTKVTFIPYKGTAPELLDLVAGRLDVASTAVISALPFIKSGKLRALAITDANRSRLFPDLPTVAEQGLPGFSYTNWTAFFVPRATPSAIVSKLSESFARVARSPDVMAAAEAQGNVMVGSTPEQISRIVASETARWQKLVQDVGIQMEE